MISTTDSVQGYSQCWFSYANVDLHVFRLLVQQLTSSASIYLACRCIIIYSLPTLYFVPATHARTAFEGHGNARDCADWVLERIWSELDDPVEDEVAILFLSSAARYSER